MKKILLIAVLSCTTLLSYAQVTFERGFFVDNQGNKVECLIKDPDKITNPSEFEYKLSPDTEPKLATINSVQEFEISGTDHRYVRATVSIDRSSDNTYHLDTRYSPVFKEEVLFLRVSLRGAASLYAYYDTGGLIRFFYSIDDSPIEPLVYKKYLTEGNKIGENVTFKQQLLNALKCGNVSGLQQMNRLAYKERQLHALFVKYNECRDASYQSFQEKAGKGKWTITVKAGANSSALETRQTVVITPENPPTLEPTHIREFNSSFNSTISPQVGVAFEYIVSSHRNRWSFFFEPGIQFFRDTYKFRNYCAAFVPSNPGAFGSQIADLTVNYTHLMLPIGARHHFFLSDNSTLTGSCALAFFVLPNPSKVFKAEGYSTPPEFEQTRARFMPFGIASIAYKFRKKYSVEAGYQFGKTMLDNEDWRIRMANSVSIIFGYRLR